MSKGLWKKAIFLTDIPDDYVEDEDGDIVVFGGQGVARALCELFQRLGFETEEPTHEHEHGWDVFVRKDKRTLFVEVTDAVDAYFLQTEDCTFILRSLFRPNRKWHAEALNSLNAEMQKDPRFGEIRWYVNLDKAREGGALAPGGLN